MVNNWLQVFEDMEKERKKAVSREQKKAAQMEKRAQKAEQAWTKLHDKYVQKQKEYYAILTELEEEKEKNQKLTARVNRDFENSSVPSSFQKVGRKKIPNIRVKTGKRPGGQPGHKGHCRRKHLPTEIHVIPAPEKYSQNPDYYETRKIIRKQKVALRLSVEVTEYQTKMQILQMQM